MSINGTYLNNKGMHMIERHKALAEQFLHGVYGGNPSIIDELASDDIVSSYPVFLRLFNAPSIRGREALKKFVVGFAERWSDPQITIHEAVAEEDRVVLIWSFRATRVDSSKKDDPTTNLEHRWGGITLFRFDSSGRIVAEIGEESEPGPIERLKTGTT
jgi:hypothetical protein